MTWRSSGARCRRLPTRSEYYVRPGYGPYATLVTAVNADAPPVLPVGTQKTSATRCRGTRTRRALPSQYGLPSGNLRTGGGRGPSSLRRGTAGTAPRRRRALPARRSTRDPERLTVPFPEIPVGVPRDPIGHRSLFAAGEVRRGRRPARDRSDALEESGGEWNARIRVTSGGQVTEYILDRWD